MRHHGPGQQRHVAPGWDARFRRLDAQSGEVGREAHWLDEVGLVVQAGPAGGAVEHVQTAGDRGYGGEDVGRRRVAARAACAGVVAVPDGHQRPGPGSRRGESAARRRRRAGRSGLRPDQGAPRPRAACRTGGGPTWAAFGYALVSLPLGIINLTVTVTGWALARRRWRPCSPYSSRRAMCCGADRARSSPRPPACSSWAWAGRCSTAAAARQPRVLVGLICPSRAAAAVEQR